MPDGDRSITIPIGPTSRTVQFSIRKSFHAVGVSLPSMIVTNPPKDFAAVLPS